MRKALHILLSAVVLLLASAGSDAIAATHTHRRAVVNGTIHACENNATGALYVKAVCPRGYTTLQWSLVGPTGPAGPPGKGGSSGANGSPGANGAAATVSVGTVTTGAPGSSASVTNVGSPFAATLNFTLPQGPVGPLGPAGPTGAAGAAGTSPWTKPTIMTNNQNTGVHACPYSASTTTSVGTPATTIDFNGSSYVYTGTTCKDAQTFISGVNFNTNTPDVDPSDWTQIAAAGANGTANAWAVIDPGLCANGASCNNPTLAHGGVPGSGIGFVYNARGQYQLTINGCTASTTPASGHPDPVAITVTPEGAYPGESSNDSSLIWVTPEIRDTVSMGVLNGLGGVSAYLYLGVPDTTTVGQYDAVDEPFAVSAIC